MRRRDFIKVIGGGAVAWPLVARAQQSTMPVIGFISGTWPDADRLRALRQGLKETGYIEGENLIITYGWAEGRFERLPAMIAELIRRQVAVIVPVGTPPTLAAVAATKTIPITFVIGEDPVRLGIVASLSRPGGNATGINLVSVELAAKRLELLRELLPETARVAVLINPADAATAESTLKDVEPAARAIGLRVQILNASTAAEIDAAFATIARERPDAIFVASDPFFTSRRVQLANLASRHVIPMICGTREITAGRWTNELWLERPRCVASTRDPYRPCSQWREARGPAGRASLKVRTCHQHADRQNPRANGATGADSTR